MNYLNKNKNMMGIQGGQGGNPSADAPPIPPCCAEPPTPQGPPDTYWVWPPYVKNQASAGYQERWFQRDFLSENLEIPRDETHYTLMYVEKLKAEHGGAISSVWAPRRHALVAPGNSFVEGLIIFGDPQGWKASGYAYPGRTTVGADKTSHFMLQGKLQAKNINKIEKAGGYIFEVMKIINNNNYRGDGSTKLAGDYASILSGSEFFYELSAPTSTSHDAYINTNKIYPFINQTDEGVSIVKNYITKLSKTTGDMGFINYWNSLPWSTNIAPQTPITQAPQDWSLDELAQAFRDPWLAWGADGKPVDAICAGIFPLGFPNLNFNALNPNEGPANFSGEQKALIQYITYAYHFLTARTYYIDICIASKIYCAWRRSKTNGTYNFSTEFTDYPSLRNGIKLEILTNIYQTTEFRKHLLDTQQLTDFIKPYRAALTDDFQDFVGWFETYDLSAVLKLFTSNTTIANDETKLIDGNLYHRISWEEAGLLPTNNDATALALSFGSNIIVGPMIIEDLPPPTPNDPICIELGACCYYDTENNYIECEENILKQICLITKGVFHSDTSCAEASCETPTTPPPTTTPEPTGSCCISQGSTAIYSERWTRNSCSDNITPSECESLGGSFTINATCISMNSLCEKLGACCYFDITSPYEYHGCSENIDKVSCVGDSGTHYMGQTCAQVNCEPTTTTTSPPAPAQRWAITDVSLSTNGYAILTKTIIEEAPDCPSPDCPVEEIISCEIIADPATTAACNTGSCSDAVLSTTTNTLNFWKKTSQTKNIKEYLDINSCDLSLAGNYCVNNTCTSATKAEYDIAKTINPNIGSWSVGSCNG